MRDLGVTFTARTVNEVNQAPCPHNVQFTPPGQTRHNSRVWCVGVK